eukprot:scaffold19434_cov69-Phaeocystis_antarctica.AAC.2
MVAWREAGGRVVRAREVVLCRGSTVLCAELHGRTLLPPPPRAARVQACLWKVLLPRDAACTRRAALTSARGDRAPHGSAFGKLRRRPTAPHRGPAGLANAGQAASSASARSRWPRRTAWFALKYRLPREQLPANGVVVAAAQAAGKYFGYNEHTVRIWRTDFEIDGECRFGRDRTRRI